jgi:hypothetical protein
MWVRPYWARDTSRLKWPDSEEATEEGLFEKSKKLKRNF